MLKKEKLSQILFFTQSKISNSSEVKRSREGQGMWNVWRKTDQERSVMFVQVCAGAPECVCVPILVCACELHPCWP